MTPELLTPNEVATHLNVSVQRIYQLVEAGQLPHVRLGQTRRTIRVPRTAWEAWLAQQEAQALASVRPKDNTQESRN